MENNTYVINPKEWVYLPDGTRMTYEEYLEYKNNND